MLLLFVGCGRGKVGRVQKLHAMIGPRPRAPRLKMRYLMIQLNLSVRKIIKAQELIVSID